ncbi:sex peptide receptor-related protein 2-like [Saccostrea echinata]|uniref:sex peptide receptor-related protein 2-like n=1 Tax=Saccostrea echinata TaxID=191078 RepID=UPI002A81F7CA|nr:sex peptide receptor-related protein 2-like [Saccostrea echinata]
MDFNTTHGVTLGIFSLVADNTSHFHINGNLSSVNDTNASEYSYYYYYYDTVALPYKVDVFASWQNVILGYVYFLLSLLTILINCLVFAVFIWKRIRTPTSVVLLALAISNTIICATIMPSAYHLYMKGYHTQYLSYHWCVVRHVLYIAHQMSRTSSNWLVALLGIQRSIIVLFPFQAKRYCSMRNTCISIAVIFLAAFLIFICESLIIDISPLEVIAEDGITKLPDSCLRDFAHWFKESSDNLGSSVITNYIVTEVFSRLLPCIVLSVTTCVLTFKLLCKGKTISEGSQNSSFTDKKIYRATIMLFVILFLFLASELQDCIAFFIYVHEIATNNKRGVLSEEEDKAWDTIGVVIWLLVYNVNSWIFFFMSSQFREAFYKMYTPNLPLLKDSNNTGTTLLKSANSSPRSGNRSRVKTSRDVSPDSRQFLNV